MSRKIVTFSGAALTGALLLLVFLVLALTHAPAHVLASNLLQTTAEPTYTITGVVRDWDGAALPDIYLDAQPSIGRSASTHTDAMGVYTLTVIAGTYRVTAGRDRQPGPSDQVVIVPPAATGVDFTFARFYRISGVVRNHEGVPVARARVSTNWDDLTYTSADTDNAGFYALQVVAGVYHLRSELLNTRVYVTRTLTVPPEADDVDFTLPPGYLVTGTVRDWDGASLANASVTLAHGGKYADAWGVTDASGAYRLIGVAGTYTITVNKWPLPPPPARSITLPPDHRELDFSFPLRHTIRGTVRDADGRPESAVWVRATTDDFSTAERTDAAGAYTLTVGAGVYQVSVGGYGAPSYPVQRVTVPPDATGVDFTFPPRYTVTGVVRDHNGVPLAERTVSLTRENQQIYPSGFTDARGVYTLTLDAGTYRISTTRFGLQSPPERIVTVPPSSTGNDLTFPPTFFISGIVRDWDGIPQPFVAVSVRDAYGWDLVMGSTDVTGAYTLTLDAGTYSLRAGNAGWPASPDRVLTVPPAVTGVDLALPRPYLIRGTVRDHEGKPMRNVDVYIEANNRNGGATLTDGNGAYTLLVAPGKYVVYMGKGSYSPVAERRVAVPPDAAGIDFTFPLPPVRYDYDISGTVRDQDGSPVAGADVYAGSLTTTSATDGAYSITVPAGEYYVSARKAGYQKSAALLLPVPPAMTGVDLLLERRDRVIHGVVTDSDGRPLAGIEVEAANAICRDMSGSPNSIRTAADGVYTITVPAGIHLVTAWSAQPGYGWARQVVDLLAGGPESMAQVNFMLGSPTHTISGQVRYDTGRPVSLARVFAQACGQGFQATADTSGIYTLTVRAGTFWLQASDVRSSKPASSGRLVVAAPPDVTEANLSIPTPPIYTVRGQVLDDQGWPILWARVTTLPGGADHASGMTNAEGTYALLLRAGSYQIQAEQEGYISAISRVVLPPDQAGVDFALSPVGTPAGVPVSGTVRDALGQPVASAWICYRPAAGGGSEKCRDSYFNGAYAFTLAPGAYQVSVQDSCYATSAAQPVTVTAEGAAVDLVMHRLERFVSGRVTDARGQPVCGATVTADDATLYYEVSDREGAYYWALPSGAHVVTATKDGYGVATIQVAPGPVYVPGVDFALALPPNTIRGTVWDRLGATVPGAAVQVSGPVEIDPVATGADGRYALYVPDGSWQVTVSRPGRRAFPAAQSVRVPPSKTAVDFQLELMAGVERRYLPLLLRVQ